MKTTDYIPNTIDRLPKGYVFTYEDFIDTVNKKEAIIKALNRMAVSGKIAKLSKGKYYKPEQKFLGIYNSINMIVFQSISPNVQAQHLAPQM